MSSRLTSRSPYEISNKGLFFLCQVLAAAQVTLPSVVVLMAPPPPSMSLPLYSLRAAGLLYVAASSIRNKLGPIGAHLHKQLDCFAFCLLVCSWS